MSVTAHVNRREDRTPDQDEPEDLLQRAPVYKSCDAQDGTLLWMLTKITEF